MASFTFRRSVLTKPETWKTTPQGITLSYDGINESLCAYQNIKLIRLFYYPTRMKTNNYVCRLDFHYPPSSMKFSSVSYVSFANFEDKATEYSAFAKDLMLNVAQQNPNCKFYAGKEPWKFVLENLLVISILVFIFLILNMIGSFSLSAIIIFKFLIIGFSLIYIAKAFLANWPRKMNPNNIPPKVLPPA